MARSITTIYNGLLAAKAAQTPLNVYTSTSNTALWRLYLWVVAACTYILETDWDTYTGEVNGIVANLPTGTLQWYVQQLYIFQINYLLSFINNVVTYAVIDPSAQIIKYASATVAIVNNIPTIVMKVAAQVGGVPSQLDPVNQLPAVVAYINQIKFAGTNTLVISEPADNLRIYATIYYDSTLDLPTFSGNVQAAILASVNQIAFNGIIYAGKVEDAIQGVPGVVDVVINSITASGYLDGGVFSPIGRYYLAEAGYLQIDPANNLGSTLTFIASAT